MMYVTYIQRLRKPDNPFHNRAFGGGHKNGGLSYEAANLVSKIWAFDYMGAAEFEFGRVPRTLEEIRRYWHDGRARMGVVDLPEDIYYICKDDAEAEVKRTIKGLYDREQRYCLKEYCFLKDSIEEEGYGAQIFGWLALDYDFMFFKDKKMYSDTLDFISSIACNSTLNLFDKGFK